MQRPSASLVTPTSASGGFQPPDARWVEEMLATLAPSRRSRDGAKVAGLVRELVPEAATGRAGSGFATSAA